MIISLFGFLVLMHVLYDFMMLVMASSMLSVVVMMVNMSTSFMFLHVMHMVFVLMRMFVSSWMNVLMMFVMMFHDVLTSCDDV